MQVHFFRVFDQSLMDILSQFDMQCIQNIPPHSALSHEAISIDVDLEILCK